MPRPVQGRYLPALDGLRAIAVALVIGYHVAAPGMGGGLLGVAVFFTLSGYLITTILLRSFRRTGGLELKTFWLRRARRLLPAVLVVLAVVLALTFVMDRAAMPAREIEALSALFYVANWATIARGVSYFQRFDAPSPLSHLWSLAVEEQFYLIWPLLLLLLLRVCRGQLRRVAAVTTALAAGSFLLLSILHTPGLDNTRAYEGTDTRAGGLLLGAALAMLWRPREIPEGRSAPRVFDIIGVAGLIGIGWLVMTTDEYSASLYRGGLLLLTLSTLAAIVGAVQPGTLFGRVLGTRPFTWLGERSYGVYLWHLPVIALMPASVFRTVPWVRSGLAILITLVVSTLSWRILEDPIRRLGFKEAFRRIGSVPTFARTSAIVMTSLLTLGLTFGLAYAGTWVTDRVRPDGGSLAVSAPTGVNPGDESALVPPDAKNPTNPDSPPSLSTGSSGPTSTGTPSGSATTDIPGQSGLKTSCKTVVHIGESTSLGFIRPDYVPNAADRIEAQYKRVGVDKFISEIAGARSIIEVAHGAPNAQTVVDKYVNATYDGCWVIAMGTNESANINAGGVLTRDERIDLLMKKIPSNQPVLWLTVKTLLDRGPYRNDGMQEMDAALVRATERYPNMRVYDWAAEVQDKWYIFDGIHFSTYGYTQRARRLANALAIAFPASGDWSSDKVVGSAPKQ